MDGVDSVYDVPRVISRRCKSSGMPRLAQEVEAREDDMMGCRSVYVLCAAGILIDDSACPVSVNEEIVTWGRVRCLRASFIALILALPLSSLRACCSWIGPMSRKPVSDGRPTFSNASSPIISQWS